MEFTENKHTINFNETNGRISDIKIFNEILTKEEIQSGNYTPIFDQKKYRKSIKKESKSFKILPTFIFGLIILLLGLFFLDRDLEKYIKSTSENKDLLLFIFNMLIDGFIIYSGGNKISKTIL
jgi:hypothetical protein